MTGNSTEKKKFTVLIVDDEKDYRDTMALWLETEGYEVEVASSGQDAIEKIKKGGERVVFLDIKMRGKNGIETLREIRDIDASVPVIMITAHGDEKALRECQELGIVGFFPKGDNFNRAANMISAALRTLKR